MKQKRKRRKKQFDGREEKEIFRAAKRCQNKFAVPYMDTCCSEKKSILD